MENTQDRSLSGDSTRALFSGLIGFALLIPLLVTVSACLYSSYTETALAKSQIKQLAFLTWWVTLAGLVVFGLKNRRGSHEPIDEINFDDRTALSGVNPAELAAMKWEQRKATRLFVRSYLVSMLLPCLGVSIAMVGLYLLHIPIRHREAVTILQVYGVSCLALIVRSASRSRGERMIYFSSAEGLKS